MALRTKFAQVKCWEALDFPPVPNWEPYFKDQVSCLIHKSLTPTSPVGQEEEEEAAAVQSSPAVWGYLGVYHRSWIKKGAMLRELEEQLLA